MKTNRREFFQTIGVSALGLGLATTPLAISSCAGPNRGLPDDPILQIGDDIALTDTTNGPVKGYILRDIYYFLGIPYGASTSGANRFVLPQKPEPWDDPFSAVWWPNTAPQNMENRYANDYASFRDHWNYYDVNEDCLALNVFTPGYNDGRQRPVLVWLHGGGFTNGNGIEQDGYNGENIARSGDIVFCSVNHRLGPMGFTNLAGVGGNKYAASGNVGMMDIVAALEWVRDNIENFGGDPDNVTIMGQSGGGAKVCTLTAMPSAQGLFHKAVVLSGASTRAGDNEYSERLGSYVVQEAGLRNSQVDQLQEMPWEQYYELANRAADRLSEDMTEEEAPRRGGFRPVVDGEYLPQHPYYPDPAPTAANVPMMICSTFHEWGSNMTNPEMENWTFDQVKNAVSEQLRFGEGLGDQAGPVVDAYAEAFPEAKPIEIMAMIQSNRQSTIELANSKVRQDPPVFLAWFGWQPPMFNGRMRAFHCIDISFWFNNTDLMYTHTGGGERPRELSRKMSGALVQFMNNGNPNGGGLPQWPAYTTENGETMVLNDDSEVQNDPDREAREMLPA